MDNVISLRLNHLCLSIINLAATKSPSFHLLKNHLFLSFNLGWAVLLAGRFLLIRANSKLNGVRSELNVSIEKLPKNPKMMRDSVLFLKETKPEKTLHGDLLFFPKTRLAFRATDSRAASTCIMGRAVIVILRSSFSRLTCFFALFSSSSVTPYFHVRTFLR